MHVLDARHALLQRASSGALNERRDELGADGWKVETLSGWLTELAAEWEAERRLRFYVVSALAVNSCCEHRRS